MCSNTALETSLSAACPINIIHIGLQLGRVLVRLDMYISQRPNAPISYFGPWGTITSNLKAQIMRVLDTARLSSVLSLHALISPTYQNNPGGR